MSRRVGNLIRACPNCPALEKTEIASLPWIVIRYASLFHKSSATPLHSQNVKLLFDRFFGKSADYILNVGVLWTPDSVFSFFFSPRGTFFAAAFIAVLETNKRRPIDNTHSFQNNRGGFFPKYLSKIIFYFTWNKMSTSWNQNWFDLIAPHVNKWSTKESTVRVLVPTALGENLTITYRAYVAEWILYSAVETCPGRL